MTGRRTIVGLSLLCALLFSALGVASASAANGATAFTCKKVTPSPGTAGFSKAHCKPEDAVSTNAEYEHVAIPVDETTQIRAQNLNTEGKRISATLTTTAGGVGLEITCEIVETTGDIKNVVPAANEMQVHGTELLFHYKNCTVPKPVGQNCKIKGGEITTEKLTSTTTDATGTLTVKFSPEAGPETTIVNLTLEGCKTAGLNTTYPIKGSVEATPSGTTLTTTPEHAGLTFGGAAMKLNQSQTVKMYNAGTEVEEDGIALTTTTN